MMVFAMYEWINFLLNKREGKANGYKLDHRKKEETQNKDLTKQINRI